MRELSATSASRQLHAWSRWLCIGTGKPDAVAADCDSLGRLPNAKDGRSPERKSEQCIARRGWVVSNVGSLEMPILGTINI